MEFGCFLVAVVETAGLSTSNVCSVYGARKGLKCPRSSTRGSIRAQVPTVVTRKGPFMANKDIFLKKSFQVVDSFKPDFDLLVKKFDEESRNPEFKSNIMDNLKKYSKGLYILRSPQCPYTEKNVKAILKSAKNKSFFLYLKIS